MLFIFEIVYGICVLDVDLQLHFFALKVFACMDRLHILTLFDMVNYCVIVADWMLRKLLELLFTEVICRP